MKSFHSKFPDIAKRETRCIHVRDQADLPDGEYDFFESYCDEADCDCRRVMISVMRPDDEFTIWATINYGWESLEFYEEWNGTKYLDKCKGPFLDPLNPQTEYAPALLRIFKEFALKDEVFMERLKRHYFLFKGAAHETNRKSNVISFPGRRARGKVRGKKKRR